MNTNYTPNSIKHDPADFFERQGFKVFHRSPFHYQIECDGVLLDYWPTTNRAMVFGKVFRASPERVVEKLNNGGLKMPSSAKRVDCCRCGEPIFWVRTKRGRWLPVEATGANHIGRCRGSK